MTDYYGELCTRMYESTKSVADGKELDFYLSFVKDKNMKVLEPMCGNGRMLIPFMQKGVRIEGFDISEEMLAVCKEKGEKLQLKPNVWYEKIQDYIGKNEYDLIIIPFASFSLLPERKMFDDEWIVLYKKVRYNAEESMLITNLKYQSVKNGQIEKTETMDFPLRLYDLEEFEHTLKSNGLHHIVVHEVKDGYGEGSPFHVLECSIS